MMNILYKFQDRFEFVEGDHRRNYDYDDLLFFSFPRSSPIIKGIYLHYSIVVMIFIIIVVGVTIINQPTYILNLRSQKESDNDAKTSYFVNYEKLGITLVSEHLSFRLERRKNEALKPGWKSLQTVERAWSFCCFRGFWLSAMFSLYFT